VWVEVIIWGMDVRRFACKKQHVELSSSFMTAIQASEEPRLFQTVIEAFAVAGEEDSKTWPAIITQFKEAFKEARTERAAYTPYLNILEVFGIKLRELRHSQVVEWFLNEDAAHEQGALFLNSLATHLGWAEANTANYHVQREKPERVDIAAFKRGDFAIFVENKVRHDERLKQMEDLINALIAFGNALKIPISKRFAVFLTDDGRKPWSVPPVMPKDFNNDNLQWMDRVTLFNLFLSALQKKEETERSPILLAFLTNYIETISTHPGALS